MTFAPRASAAPILEDITLRLPRGHIAAVIGPSGCGKSTLLKIVAGILHGDGRVRWDGRDLAEEQDLQPWEIGYVPQFGIAFEHLSVRENVDCALRLRAAMGGRARREVVDGTLRATGLEDIAGRRTVVLSGGQRRRLALAQELAAGPDLLLCDEVTSGLDPRAESEIDALLCGLAGKGDRVVLHVTHSLANMHHYDSLVVLHEGRLTYHGPPGYLLHYFGAETSDEIFPVLGRRRATEWAASWAKHGASYALELGVPTRPTWEPGREAASGLSAPWSGDTAASELRDFFDSITGAFTEAEVPLAHVGRKERAGDIAEGGELADKVPQGAPESRPGTGRLPGFLTQARVCFGRRMKVFLRDRGQLGLQLALLLGFPLLVVVFALEGLPSISNLSMGLDVNPLDQLREAAAFTAESFAAGMLVSGLVVFQMILLALMGANNAAREIAGERQIVEKEKLTGLRPFAYVAGKAAFVVLLAAVQSSWMAVFVDAVVRFPGGWEPQMLTLFLMNLAITGSSLAISAFARTADQASLLSIYLVGFQLPLSGALLVLPGFAEAMTRPFIACYWAWSGFLQTMRFTDTRHYDVAVQVAQTTLSPYALSVWVLVSHAAIMLFLAYLGTRRARWD